MERADEHALHEGFCIAGWRVEPELNRMEKQGQVVHLELKVMQVLVCLAEKPGQVVPRAVLMERVWAGTIVGENLLSRCVSELRKIFGDDPQRPHVIETIRARGYRLITPVTPAAAPRGPGVPHATDAEPHPARSRHRRSVPGSAILVVLLSLSAAGYLLLTAERPGLRIDPAHVVPLTSFPGQERTPAFSPDGNQVAFVRHNGADIYYDLFVKLVDAEQPLRLTDTPAREGGLAWSPDGRQIAFLRRAENTCGLYVMPAFGGSERKLDACAPDINPGLAWSPDGQWLAYSARPAPEAPYAIVLFDRATLTRRILTAPPTHYRGDRQPVFSPDGQTLAFTRGLNGWVEHLYTMSLTDGSVRQRTSDNRDLQGVDWTSDGKALVFSSNIGGNYGLWRVSSAGGPLRWINTAGWKIKHPALSRTGSYLAYENWAYDINIWRMPLGSNEAAGAGPTRLIASTWWDLHPAIAPDNRRIAFTSTRSGHFEIWTCDADGAHLEQVTTFGGPYVGTPRWSLDGRRLAFDARPDGYADVYVVDVETKRPRRLTQNETNDLAPRWSRDGEAIYFASDRSGSWQVWTLPAAGGPARQVTQAGGYVASESWEGTALYYTKNGKAGLWRRPLEGGEEVRVFDALAPEDQGNWVVRDDGIYFVDRGEGYVPVLSLYRFATRQITPIATLPAVSATSGFAFAPDGQWVLFNQTDRYESDLMLVKDFR